MLRRAFTLGTVLAGAVFGLATARGAEDTRMATQFIQGLRDKGYYDLAADFLEKLRAEPSTPADLRAVVDYELGRVQLDEASKTGDLIRRKELLEEARTLLDAFTRAHPKHVLASEALVQLARLLVERGHLAMLMGDETDNKADKTAKVAEARGSFDQARTAYAQAEQKLKAEYDAFPRFLPDDDPRKEKRDRVHASLMDAQLQRAVVDYEQGQTFTLGTKERSDFLEKGLAQFEDLYKRYRTQWAGLTARMWQAKCYEEKGDLGPAMGIYNELMEHQDPRLRPLQRHVGYFRIIVLAKRKEYALAADDAVRWLEHNNNAESRRSKEGLGVQFELAKNILAQVPTVPKDADKQAAIKRAADLLGEVVRFSSPFKTEALELLKKYKPATALRLGDVAKMSYEDAMGQADQAISSHEWDRAISLLRHAIRRADPVKDPDKANLARYNMAFCYYMNKQFYEANVLTEHLARRYPHWSFAAKGTEIGMASLADAYNTYTQIDRTSDLNNLIALANYTAETWADQEQGDGARMTLGQIYQGMGQYAKAIAAYEAVRTKSAKWIDAQTHAGASHWEQSFVERRKNDPAKADAEVVKALSALKAAMKGRQDSGALPTDPGLVGNACDMADIYLETSKPADALALLDPIVKLATAGASAATPPAAGTPAAPPTPQTALPVPVFARLMADMLRAHIANNQVDLALNDMSTLEKSGGSGTSLTQLYFSLGKLLEKEMDALKKKGDTAALARTQQAYQKFLFALVNAKAGQTYDSLQWAGENMLALGNPKEAGSVFQGILKSYETNPTFLAQKGGKEMILRTKLKLAAALRGQSDFTAASSLVEQLLAENPRMVEPRIEKGMLLEDKAKAGMGTWNEAFNQWKKLALQLAGQRPKPPDYYDAWYHAALAQFKDGKADLARQTLGSVMRLSPTVGGPAIKTKYTELLAQMHK